MIIDIDFFDRLCYSKKLTQNIVDFFVLSKISTQILCGSYGLGKKLKK